MLRAAFVGSANCLILAGLAYAADKDVSLVIDPQQLPWLTWVWVVGLSIAAWFASSAPSLVGWIDGDGIPRARIRFIILARVVVSLLAGGTAYFLTVFSGASNLVAFIAVIGASYGGDKYLGAMSDRVINGGKP